MQERLQLLHQWVAQSHPVPLAAIEAASADASFRRYFRFPWEGGQLIVMDAPPENEDCRLFVRAAELFGAAGLQVPRILRSDLEQGFMLLTDLGRTTYLDCYRETAAAGSAKRSELVRAALSALVRLQLASQPAVLPDYTEALLQREMALFPEWYLSRHLGLSLSGSAAECLGRTRELLCACAISQPKVFVHRDYHSRNLMVHSPGPGVLDFQDAVYGPITYDVVSLLRDAYWEWSEEEQLDALVRYWEQARAAALPVAPDFGDFYRDFEWMGAQRQLKVLGIFARLYHRDGKPGYLEDMPLVARGLLGTCRRYRELRQLAELLERWGEAPGSLQTGFTF